MVEIIKEYCDYCKKETNMKKYKHIDFMALECLKCNCIYEFE